MDDAFLGKGWAFPPAFANNGGTVAMASGVEDIHQSLQILLATRLGERVMQEDFGCSLDAVMFEEVDQGLINSINSLITTAVIYHEPRIKMENIDISADTNGLLLISLNYTVPSSNSRYNMVYPFYINGEGG